MPFQIVANDIANMTTDAIVYADTPQPFSMFQFNPLMIQEKGREILKSREAVKPLLIAQSKIIPASPLLDCKYIIHTSAPAWHGGRYGELGQLRDCYEKSFALALEYGCKTIALPIIAYDKLGYPKSVSKKMAFECINEFIRTHNDIRIYLLFPKHTAVILPGNQYSQIDKLFDQQHTGPKEKKRPVANRLGGVQSTINSKKANDTPAATNDISATVNDTQADTATGIMIPDPQKLQEFTSFVNQQIQSLGLSKEELCLRSNLSPDQLDEILEAKVHPKKHTATALGLALNFTFEELKELIALAGYSFTTNSKFDLIIEYCISNGIYDFNDVNLILFRFEQPLLG